MRGIKKYASRFLTCSPYDLEEFVAQAYLSAVEAQIKASSNCKPFDYYFWNEYTNACRKMTYLKRTSYSQPSPRHINIDNIEIASDMPMRPFQFHPEPKSEDINSSYLTEILALMTEKQREIWREILSGKNLSEVARNQNITRQAIQKRKTSSIKRVKNKIQLALKRSINRESCCV